MSTIHRFEPDRLQPTPALGATELTSFAALPANDNAQDGAEPTEPRWVAFVLPAVTFASGLTAALIVAGIGRALGLTS